MHPLTRGFTDKEAASPTPDLAAELGFRGYLKNVGGNLVNFYNPEDFVLKLWDQNNLLFKPDGLTERQTTQDRGQKYLFDANGLPDGVRKGKLWFPDNNVTRLITDRDESMSFVARSRTVTAGRLGNTNGVIANTDDNRVNLQAEFNFGGTAEDHSAQWERHIQKLTGFYDRLLEVMGIPHN